MCVCVCVCVCVCSSRRWCHYLRLLKGLFLILLQVDRRVKIHCIVCFQGFTAWVGGAMVMGVGDGWMMGVGDGECIMGVLYLFMYLSIYFDFFFSRRGKDEGKNSG